MCVNASVGVHVCLEVHECGGVGGAAPCCTSLQTPSLLDPHPHIPSGNTDPASSPQMSKSLDLMSSEQVGCAEALILEIYTMHAYVRSSRGTP